MRRQDPKGDDDGQENDNVEDQKTILDLSPDVGGPDIDNAQDDDHGEHQKSALPPLWLVVWVVDHEKGLDDGSSQERPGRVTRLPRQSGHPTDDVRERLL